MLGRFSLYGFLKNQQYYDPFLILAFRQMGLSFFVIGLLSGFREVIINLMEIPSGAMADLFGRRKAMIFSFAAYIVSFLAFGFTGMAAGNGTLPTTTVLALLFGAMFCFGVGEAFRTGTHKAMIFTWLRVEGRLNERTRVYGFTRSWSKLGSALSVILSAAFVFSTGNYYTIFFFSIIPYILGIINFLGYPAEVDGDLQKETSIKDVMQHLQLAFSLSLKNAGLRRLLYESMSFEGFFNVCKDYLQPVLKATAMPLTAALLLHDQWDEPRRVAVLVGPVYFVLYLFSAWASRKAYVLVDKQGGEDQAAHFLWLISFLILTAMVPGIYFGWYAVMIPGFIALYVLQNFWRPVLISRIDNHSDEIMGATVMSIESQAKSLSTMILAPLMGWVVDKMAARSIGQLPFWPVVLMGAVIALVFVKQSKTPMQAV